MIYNNQATTPYLVLILVGLLFAFLPLLGWRLSYGHENYRVVRFVVLYGTFPGRDDRTTLDYQPPPARARAQALLNAHIHHSGMDTIPFVLQNP